MHRDLVRGDQQPVGRASGVRPVHGGDAQGGDGVARTRPRSTPASLKGHKRLAKIPTGGLTADDTDGRAQAAALGHAGMPVYYPRLIKAGSNYCVSLTGNCVGGGEPPEEYAHSYPREYQSATSRAGRTPPTA